MAGAPKGNQNAKRAAVFRKAIERALEGRTGSLDRIVGELIGKAEAGDLAAIREIADRLDGKPAQALEHTGADGEPIQIAWPLPKSPLDQ